MSDTVTPVLAAKPGVKPWTVYRLPDGRLWPQPDLPSSGADWTDMREYGYKEIE